MARVSKPQNTWSARSWVVLTLMMAGLVALFGHVVWLQATEAERYRRAGLALHERTIELPSKRGMILDRRGEPLAVSTPVETVWAVPQELSSAPERLPELAQAVGVKLTALQSRIKLHAGKEFMFLKRQLAPEHAHAIKDLNVPGVYLRREYRRFYPLGSLTAHTVGLTNIDDRGQEGFEYIYQAHLSGTKGEERVLRDRRRRDIAVLENITRVRDGDDLALTLDTRIQYLTTDALTDAIREHKARSGIAVVVDIASGDVLALANFPAFNPNNRKSVNNDNLRNRAITDVFEPGSTLKPFAIAAALQENVVTPGTVVETDPGYVRIGKHTIRDHHNYGDLTVHGVMVKSSNVGTIRVAHLIDPARQVTLLQRFGFGQPTGIGFPGESSGRFDVEQRWGKIQHASLSIGYGISVTALQLVQAYATLANGGVRMPLSLVRRYQQPQPVRVLDEAIVSRVNAMLADVTGDEGTARNARTRLYTTAGKTGTVKIARAGGYDDDRYLSVFAGFAPASKPRLAMVVVVTEPGGEHYYGGLVAAPVFSDVMTHALPLLNVAPDIAVDPSTNSVLAQLEKKTGD